MMLHIDSDRIQLNELLQDKINDNKYIQMKTTFIKHQNKKDKENRMNRKTRWMYRIRKLVVFIINVRVGRVKKKSEMNCKMYVCLPLKF